MAKPVVEQKLEDPQVSTEPHEEVTGSTTPLKLPSLEPKLDQQSEPTVKFLFTLLNTSEPTQSKDPEEDSKVQECPFLDEDDWGPQRTSKEMRHLRRDCMRLWESLSMTQADNLSLKEKLQSLPNSLYKILKLEEEAAHQEEAQAHQEVALLQEGSYSQETTMVVLLPNPRCDHRSPSQPWSGQQLLSRSPQ